MTKPENKVCWDFINDLYTNTRTEILNYLKDCKKKGIWSIEKSEFENAMRGQLKEKYKRGIERGALTPHIAKINMSFLIGTIFHQNCVKDLDHKKLLKDFLIQAKIIDPNIKFDYESINKEITKWVFLSNQEHFPQELKQGISELKNSILILEEKEFDKGEKGKVIYQINREYDKIYKKFLHNWPNFNKAVETIGTIDKNDHICYIVDLPSNANSNNSLLLADQISDFETSIYCVKPTNTRDNPFIISRNYISKDSIAILDESVSTDRHIEIYVNDVKNFVLSNKSNSKGIIYVNGKKLSEGETTNLTPGDRIEIGTKRHLIKVISYEEYETAQTLRMIDRCPHCVSN